MQDEVVKIKIKNNGDSSEANLEFDEVNWQFEEKPIMPKSEWLWALAILGLAIVVFSIILKNYLLTVIIALTAFIIYASKNKAPEFHSFKLNKEGLYINGKIYRYENFESFWILEDNEIAFRNKKHLMPLLIVPFDKNDRFLIEKILLDHLPESEEEESLLDLLRKKFF